MLFTDAVKTCFKKYAEFDGRAKRPEFWWFTLFALLIGAAARILGESTSALVSLATLLPSIAVGARRLHDTNRSAWWLLLWCIPLIGWIIVIIFMATPGDAAENRFGVAPTA